MYYESISSFLHKPDTSWKIIVIYGPTACGKTALSIDIAKMLQTEVISTDSRQIFQGMDIGTWKITENEKQGIVHHMIDRVKPNQKYSVWAFKKEAEMHIRNIHAQGKIPLLVWGTGLYIDSLIFENSIWNLPQDPTLRTFMAQLSNEALYEELKKIDPEYAWELHMNNRPYIERAYEVKMLTGRSKKDFREEKKLRYDTLFLTPLPDYLSKDASKNSEDFLFSSEYRVWIYERIHRRVHMMFESWLKNEVEQLLSLWYQWTDFWMKTIGYKEFEEYYHNNMTLEWVENMIAQYSRNYAKRQLTWFKKYQSY